MESAAYHGCNLDFHLYNPSMRFDSITVHGMEVLIVASMGSGPDISLVRTSAIQVSENQSK